jgi:heme exporter protein C
MLAAMLGALFRLTLHQGASVSLKSAPSMAASMFTGMILMALAFWMYSIAVALVRVRCIIRERG